MSDTLAISRVATRSANASSRGGLTTHVGYPGTRARGIRWLRAMGIHATAWTLSLCFGLPILLLTYSDWLDKATIELSSKKRVGIVYGRAVLPLLDVLWRERQAAVMAAAGATEVPGHTADGSDKAWAALESAQKAHGEALATVKAFAELKPAGQQLPAADAGVDAVFSAHTARVQALVDLLGMAADGSNLTLDPDIDSYHVMDAAFFRLPPLMDALAQLRGLGAAALNGEKATPAQMRQLIEQTFIASRNLAALEAGLAKAVATNGDVKEALRSEQAVAKVRQFLELVQAKVLHDEGAKGDAAAYLSAANRTLESIHALTQRSLDTLDRLIALRVPGSETARQVIALLLVISLAVWSAAAAVCRRACAVHRMAHASPIPRS